MPIVLCAGYFVVMVLAIKEANTLVFIKAK
jgi:hypothetical protein